MAGPRKPSESYGLEASIKFARAPFGTWCLPRSPNRARLPRLEPDREDAGPRVPAGRTSGRRPSGAFGWSGRRERPRPVRGTPRIRRSGLELKSRGARGNGRLPLSRLRRRRQWRHHHQQRRLPRPTDPWRRQLRPSHSPRPRPRAGPHDGAPGPPLSTSYPDAGPWRALKKG